ncbi:hypothetical protein D3C85_836920 [compost metagenome]
MQFLNGGGGDLVGGADRHGGLDDQGAIGLHVAGDLPGHIQHMGQVSGTILIGGCADGDEDQLGVFDGIAGLGGEEQPTGLDVLFQRSGQARFTNWWNCLLQLLDLVRINVDT